MVLFTLNPKPIIREITSVTPISQFARTIIAIKLKTIEKRHRIHIREITMFCDVKRITMKQNAPATYAPQKLSYATDFCVGRKANTSSEARANDFAVGGSFDCQYFVNSCHLSNSISFFRRES